MARSLIGVVSDTHLLPRGRGITLPGALLAGLAGVDFILHAGDIACLEVLEGLGRLAPVQAVCGNADDPGLGLPSRLLLYLHGRAVGLTHGHLGPGRSTADRAARAFPEHPAVVVFGHSHQPVIQRRPDGLLLVNPGSPTQPRGRKPTYALLELGEGTAPTARLMEM